MANYSPLSSERGWGRGFVCLPSFNLHLSTASPPQTNSKTTSSISTTNYSPLSSERGRGWGFACLPSFNFHLSTTSPLQTTPKTTSSIFTTNYSPPSSGRGWGRGFISLNLSPQQTPFGRSIHLRDSLKDLFSFAVPGNIVLFLLLFQVSPCHESTSHAQCVVWYPYCWNRIAAYFRAWHS